MISAAAPGKERHLANRRVQPHPFDVKIAGRRAIELNECLFEALEDDPGQALDRPFQSMSLGRGIASGRSEQID